MILDLLVRDRRRAAALRAIVNLPALRGLLNVNDTDDGISVDYVGKWTVSDGQMALLQFVDELGHSDRPRLPDISHLDRECVMGVYEAIRALLGVEQVPGQRGAS